MVATIGPRMSRSEVIQYVSEQAPILNIDPAATLAIAEQEGLGGESASTVPGDNGTSFGPWQLHAGGRLPAEVWAQGPAFAQAWAWSKPGIDYALQGIAGEAAGLQGATATFAISSKFEAPCRSWFASTGKCGALGSGGVDLVAKETAQATAALSRWASIVGGSIPIPGVVTDPSTITQQPGGTTAPPATTNANPAQTAADSLTGLAGALQTLIAGTIGPNLEKFGFKPDLSGLILLGASIFAILIGALLWRGDDVKSAAKEIPAMAAQAMAAA